MLRLVVALASLVVALVAGPARADVVELPPAEVCVGALEACEASAAAFVPFDGKANVGLLLPSGGTSPGDAVTMAYDLPAGHDLFLRGESNRWRARTTSGDRAAVTAPLRIRAGELVRDARGRVLVESTLAVGRTLWAHAA